MKIKDVSKISWLFYSLNAIGVNLYFSYIDEGANSFNWIQNEGDWLTFLVYALSILFGQVVVEKKLFSKYKYKIALSMLVGTTLGYLTLFLVFLILYLIINTLV